MIAFFVKRPVTTIMFVVFFIVLGLVSFFNLRVEKQPKIDFPIVTVTTVYPGATPLEIELSVINKIEDAVAELSGIKNIRSQSFDNFGYVFIEFLLESDVNIKFIEVKDKVEAIINNFPDDVKKPVVEKFDPLIEPVMNLVLASDVHDAKFLYELADKKLKDKFSSYKGVANVKIYGGQQRQINVSLDPLLMKQHYVDIRDVLMSLKANNKNVPGGLLEKNNYALNLQFSGELESVDDIANMILISRNGEGVKLKDIAIVEDGIKKVDTIARYNGSDVVALSLQKVSDGNAIEIAKNITNDLDEINASLPKGASIEISTDNTTFIIDETKDATWGIVIGVLLTVLILYLFTGNLKSTFIAAIVIPASIISAFTFVNASGFTINFLTLLAISTTLGTLIANAIVIIENTLEHIEKGEDHEESVINGTKEVAVAVIASTGTNLVVFTPLVFMGDIVGQFMRSFGLTVIYLTIFSLLISFTLTPMLCSLLLRKKSPSTLRKQSLFLRILQFPSNITNSLVSILKSFYRKVFLLIFDFPKVTLLLVVLSLFSVKLVLPYIGSTFVPEGDEDKVKLELQMPQGSTIERSLEVVIEVEDYLKGIPELISCFTLIGDNGVENAFITLNLTPSLERERSDVDIIESITAWMSRLPGVEVNIMRGGGNTQYGDVSLYIYGDNFEKLLEVSDQVKTVMKSSNSFRSISSSYKYPKNEVSFIPQEAKLVENNIKNIEIGGVIRASVYGDTSNIYREDGHDYDINVKLNDFYTEDIIDIEQINVITRKGMTPVTELGKLDEHKAIPSIMHRNKQRGVKLDGYLSKSTLGQVRKVIDDAFLDLEMESGYGYYFIGNAERQDSAGSEILKAFILAVIFTYMLLAAIMNSALYPFPIAASIFLSFIGVFYALFFLEATINIASMLGMVMLVGIVVNSSILLIDYTIVKISEGMEIKDALWESCSKRFKPIIMTSIAIIFGVLPQMWSVMPTKSSMGTVFVGGVLASILFTFIFTPVAFWYVYKIKNRYHNTFTKKS